MIAEEIEQSTDVMSNPFDVIKVISYAVKCHRDYVLVGSELRNIDNEDVLIVKIRTGAATEEWAIPRRAIKRVGVQKRVDNEPCLSTQGSYQEP